MLRTLSHSIDVVSASRESIEAGIQLPEPNTRDEILDGLNAFKFRDESGHYERPGLADRLRQLGAIDELSDTQKQEQVALSLIRTAHALVTLFDDGSSSSFAAEMGPAKVREDILSRQGFAVYQPQINIGKTITGMARRSAELEPSPDAWRAVSVASLDTQLALYKAQKNALVTVASEPRVVRVRRGIRPYLTQLAKPLS